MDVVLLVIAFFVILAGAELFTNGIEWFGRKLELAEGAVGSVLAAVSPEVALPVAIDVQTTHHAGTADGLLPHPGVDRGAAPRHVPRQADIYRQ